MMQVTLPFAVGRSEGVHHMGQEPTLGNREKSQRHGHPSKLRGAARAFLEEQCRQAPHLSSTTLQAELHEQFGLSVSISQINRVRAMLGLNLHPKGQRQGKKQR